MSNPYLGEIRMFGGNFAPLNWAFCNGQLLSISDYDALYTLLGTVYGGDGQTTFGVPDLRGRLPIGQGTGPGLTNRTLGEMGGTEQVTLTTQQMPSHTHPFNATTAAANQTTPAGGVPATATGGTNPIFYAVTGTSTVNVVPMVMTMTAAGANMPHDDIMPSLAVNFIIALQGIYPQQN